MAAYVAPIEQREQLRANRAGTYEEGLRRWPELGEAPAPARLAANPDLVARLLRVLGRDLPPSRFLPTATLAAVIAETVRVNPGRRRAVAREAGGIFAEELRRSALLASGLRRPR